MANNSQQPSGNQAANTTNQNSASDWSEHATDDGIRYYYNTTTRQSSWEKPLELMLRDEWDDASIVWKEFTSSDGKKYYYNTTTRQSSWEKPLEFMSPVEYHEDKITVVTTPVYEDFNSAVLEEAACQTISKINLKKLLHEELVETLKVREEKKAKKRQRLADDFTNLLYSFKDITTTSVWEDCKPLFEETQEYKSVGDESYGREIFEEYITYLKGKN